MKKYTQKLWPYPPKFANFGQFLKEFIDSESRMKIWDLFLLPSVFWKLAINQLFTSNCFSLEIDEILIPRGLFSSFVATIRMSSSISHAGTFSIIVFCIFFKYSFIENKIVSDFFYRPCFSKYVCLYVIIFDPIEFT